MEESVRKSKRDRRDIVTCLQICVLLFYSLYSQSTAKGGICVREAGDIRFGQLEKV